MTIKKKLIISFLFLSMAAISVTALLGYYSAKNALEKQLKEKVMAIADAREQHLIDFLDTNKKTIATFATDGFIANEMEALREGADGSEELISDLNELLGIKMNLRPYYYELFVIDQNGIVVASTDKSKIGNSKKYDDYFVNGRNGPYIKDAYYHEKTGKNSLIFSSPIFHQTGAEHQFEKAPPHFVGVIVARIDVSYLDEIVSGMSQKEALTMSQGLGETGETYLVNKDRLMLTHSRLKENVFLKQRADTLPVSNCLEQKKETVDIYENYAGERVIGASMCITSMDWTLINEIGTDEAFMPIILFRNKTLFLSMIMALMTILFAIFIVKKIVQPIKLLTNTVQGITSGDMSKKIDIKTNDEIGILAKEFNKMTTNLAQKAADLTKSEKKFRDLFESSRDAIMTLNPPDWKFTSGNPATVRMFKAKDEKEFISYEPWKLSPEYQPDGRVSNEKAKEMIETAMRDGFNFFEWTHKRIDGEEFPATVLLSRIEQDGDLFLQATVRDITKDKKTEKDLRRFNKLAIDRELKMIELKQKIKILENKKNA